MENKNSIMKLIADHYFCKWTVSEGLLKLF